MRGAALGRTLTGLGDVLVRGAAAGLVGTAAMTLSSTVEARLRHRQGSTAPARAAQKVLGIQTFSSPSAQGRFSTMVHWGYGTGWGVARAMIAACGLRPVLAVPLHFTAMWGGALVMLPALDVTPPATQWGRTEVAIDVFHHLIYAAATGLAYQLLDQQGSAHGAGARL